MATTTLRELSGFDQTPASLTDATLILVDYQNTYTRGVMELTGWRPALDSAAALLARAREAGTKVIHVVNDGGAGTPYDIRSEIGGIHSAVAPVEGEPVVVKTVPNAFVDTDLGEHVDAMRQQERHRRRVHDQHVRDLHGGGRVPTRQPAHGGRRRLCHPASADGTRRPVRRTDPPRCARDDLRSLRGHRPVRVVPELSTDQKSTVRKPSSSAGAGASTRYPNSSFRAARSQFAARSR